MDFVYCCAHFFENRMLGNKKNWACQFLYFWSLQKIPLGITQKKRYIFNYEYVKVWDIKYKYISIKYHDWEEINCVFFSNESWVNLLENWVILGILNWS